MPVVNVRLAMPADLDEVVATHTEARFAYYRAGGLADDLIDDEAGAAARHDGWRRAIEGRDRLAVCAVAVGRIVGVASMGRPFPDDDPRIGQLHQIQVRPDFWGTGAAQALHAAFVGYLADKRLPVGQLETWERNSRARAFYARLGWRPTGVRRPGPGDGDYVQLRLHRS
jgi:RimJ/RimL family protein N-acetyltransferase